MSYLFTIEWNIKGLRGDIQRMDNSLNVHNTNNEQTGHTDGSVIA